MDRAGCSARKFDNLVMQSHNRRELNRIPVPEKLMQHSLSCSHYLLCLILFLYATQSLSPFVLAVTFWNISLALILLILYQFIIQNIYINHFCAFFHLYVMKFYLFSSLPAYIPTL